MRFGMKHSTGRLVIGESFKFVGVTTGEIASQWASEAAMKKVVDGLLKDLQFKKSESFSLLSEAEVEKIENHR